MSEASPAPTQSGPGQLLIDLGPVAIFVLAFNVLQRFAATKDNAVYIATAIFIAATLVAIAYSKLKTGRIPPVLIVTGVLITAFGGLTLALHDETFIKIKPTFMNLFFAAAIVVSLLLKQNVWKLLFGHLFTLPDRIWTVLALRWAGLFFCLGVLNEIIRHALTTSAWVTWHFPILWAPTLLFAILNTPLLMKHAVDDNQPAAPRDENP